MFNDSVATRIERLKNTQILLKNDGPSSFWVVLFSPPCLVGGAALGGPTFPSFFGVLPFSSLVVLVPV